MTKSKYEKIINSAKGRLVISGGEPILSDELFNVLKLAKLNKNLKHIELQSNGAILSYDQVINRIAKFGVVTEYNINFPSFESNLDSKITKSDLLDKRILAVKKLINKKLKVRLTFVINKFNFEFIRAYLEQVYSLFDNKVSVQLSFVQKQGNASSGEIIPKYSEIKKYLLSGLEFVKEKEMNCVIDNIPLCFTHPYDKFNVDFYKSKQKNKSYYNKQKLSVCMGCKLVNFCFGPPVDYVNFYGEEEFEAVK